MSLSSSSSLQVFKLAPIHCVALTEYGAVYPPCIPQILGGCFFLVIVVNQEPEAHGEEYSVVGSHCHCQKAVSIRFRLWKVPVF